jgi:hypothetical protein
METAMKTFVEFKGYRTRIAYDDKSKAFVQATVQRDETDEPKPATKVTNGKSLTPSRNGHRMPSPSRTR